MKILQKLLNNKTGIGLVFAHWTILWLVIEELPALVDGFDSHSGWTFILIVMIVVSDLPAIFMAGVLWSPFYIFPNDTTIFFYGFYVTSIFAISVQWLFIGRTIYNTFSPTESKLTSLSLTDE